jgi:hypothetical protein
MGIPEQPSRPKLLVGLAGFVVVFGVVAWLVTGRAGTHVLPLAHNHPAPRASPAFTPGPTPTPLACPPNDLTLAGAFNECAKTAPDATITCSVSGHALKAVLRLGGPNPDAFLLYIEVNGTFDGPGPYALPPWPHAMGTKDDVPKVAVQQDGTSAFWQLVKGVPVQNYGTDDYWYSVAGILNVLGRNGRSGTVSAILELSAGTYSTVRGSTLSVNGPWSCP